MKLNIKYFWILIDEIFDFLKYFPPFEYVQILTQREVHRFLYVDRDEIKTWIIVGGYVGKEVPKILKSYKNCKITIFECSPRYLSSLKNRFRNNSRVRILAKAVSNKAGSVKFYETNLNGSGSLLKVGPLARKSYGMEPREEYVVETSPLDVELGDLKVDVLQIDVQGAEMLVLEGARNVLENTRAVFIETSWRDDFYLGSRNYLEIQKFLCDKGFAAALLGSDANLTGNALFVKVL